jgi:hypothetical protein
VRFDALSKPSTSVWMRQSVWSFETEESIYIEFFIDQLKSSTRPKENAPHGAGHYEVALHAQDACPFALLHTVR